MSEIQIDCIERAHACGQYDSPWMDTFSPAWKLAGLPTKEEGFVALLSGLQKHKDNIVSRGFSKEVLIHVGEKSMILKGTNEGRKKDK